MLGAIIGDIVGSIYEYNNIKTKDFKILTDESFFTDDTIMTIAVAEALLKGGTADDFIDSMKKFGRLYPKADYGSNFGSWLMSDDRKPYNSWGNGSAMRVSPCAWFADSLDEAERLAELSASVTHSHPEGIKGAKATAAAIYLARTGHGKHDKRKWEIKEYIESKYGYNLSRTLDEIRPTYKFDESCQGTVPEAIIAFLESKHPIFPGICRVDFEASEFTDALRNAVSLGGDCDTLTAITGSIAEAMHKIPHEFFSDTFDIIDDPLAQVINEWLDAGKPLSSVVTSDYLHSDEELRFSKPQSAKTRINLSQKQFACMRHGRACRSQDDKWITFYQNGKLYNFRVGLGHMLYEAKITKRKSKPGYYISEITFESDPEIWQPKKDPAKIYKGFIPYRKRD
ncbi:MAG: ADP-ribosylglycohydrolase family protein [Holophagaceae bacterium]|nr:ADP-ribosylglycohydrolase family protein [Holophagaceae bacterium]